VIEDAWPIPDARGATRGVAVEGPVGSRRLTASALFAMRFGAGTRASSPISLKRVESPQGLITDENQAHRILELVPTVPPLLWGRDELGVGDMWNSNSVVSWLLARRGAAIFGGSFALRNVRDRLVPQNISFTPASTTTSQEKAEVRAFAHKRVEREPKLRRYPAV
jgi:hypothetical protein